MFYVYKIVNAINSKLYIGKTSDPKDRWRRHLNVIKNKIGKHAIHNAMESHGIENFKMIVIEEFEIEEDCFAKEIELIAHYKTNACRYGYEFGYNLTDGGEGHSGYRHTEESKSKRPKHLSQAHREAISKARKGIPASEASKVATSLRHKGKIVAPITRKKLAEQKIGSLNPQAKLTTEEVIEIKALFNDLSLTNSDIHARYKHVSARTIIDIKKGKTWKHV